MIFDCDQIKIDKMYLQCFYVLVNRLLGVNSKQECARAY